MTTKSVISRALCCLTLSVVAECVSSSGQKCPGIRNCNCTDLLVHCDGHDSTELPVGLPINSSYLKFTNYNLPVLQLSELYFFTQLEKIVLSYNKIRRIEGTLEKFKHLTEVHLEGNYLTDISPKLFGTITQQLIYVVLTDNQFNCNCGGIFLNNDICDCTNSRFNCTCNIKWLQEQVNQNPNVWVGVYCHNSSKDTDIRDVVIPDYWCRHKWGYIIGIIVVGSMIMELLIVFPIWWRERRNLSVTDKQLNNLARKLGAEWESLAITLGLTANDVYRCKSENMTVDRQIFHMLTRWRSKKGPNATIGELIEKLKSFEPPLDEETYEFLKE